MYLMNVQKEEIFFKIQHFQNVSYKNVPFIEGINSMISKIVYNFADTWYYKWKKLNDISSKV